MTNVRNKKFWIVGVVILLVGLGLFLYTSQNPYKGLRTTTYTLEGKQLKLLVADTPALQEKGLMYYRKLDGVDGMIFIFQDKLYRGFWNKNTLMDLDLYWIADKKVVGKSFLPSVEKSKEIVTVASPEPADTVIEIPVYKNQ